MKFDFFGIVANSDRCLILSKFVDHVSSSSILTDLNFLWTLLRIQDHDPNCKKTILIVKNGANPAMETVNRK